jgi:hypothetical protein
LDDRRFEREMIGWPVWDEWKSGSEEGVLGYDAIGVEVRFDKSGK